MTRLQDNITGRTYLERGQPSDKARAIELYAMQARNVEAETRACEIRLRAERRCGQMLKERDKPKRGPDDAGQGSQRATPDERSQPLAELGISKTLMEFARAPGLPWKTPETATEWSVADFFSCGGGTSAGFARRPEFKLIGAVDLELAKPSGGHGASDCNATYTANHGIIPLTRDMLTLPPEEFAETVGTVPGQLNVMISCAPCTHLSRANPDNHLTDRAKNTLIERSGEFATHLRPEMFFMENARELITGNYRNHHDALLRMLKEAGYEVRSDVHFLDRFGLPQMRERALVVASRIGNPRTLEDLWEGWTVRPEAMTVRTALARGAEWRQDHPEDDPDGDAFPGMEPAVLRRMAATPHDGGSWVDIARDPGTRWMLTPACLRRMPYRRSLPSSCRLWPCG